ncbi:cyclase family protein [Caldanaerobacter sp.]|uniref:cyclase family protein n=1 Tax=Caldanaerobacter sp. TaxID=2930036 RepID=UPI003C738063
MRMIDLSHFIENGMPQYPGQPEIKIERIAEVAKDGYQLTEAKAVVHLGTHCDAPAHFIEAGDTIEKLPVDFYSGEAVIIDVPHLPDRLMKPELLEGVDLKEGDIVIFRTGMSKYWLEEAYIKEFPYLTEELAHLLVEKRVKAIGLDTLSPDPVETEDFPVHHILLGNKVGIIENLTNLEAIDKKRFLFIALPLKIKGSDGSPVRAVAILE